ncbi:unnamed protein product [Medioppia subpectinata]|uniref:Glycolipid transfer protein domain-containing protein n=1 Tax=Medioppia subpectinata TaxID=1979941 RepID=A0A7R9PZ05_9ACAR|nr:unnamed protein product [Medioppia subpectinata]CAG2105717.1 unnamed protein product [Medioppia subpectinata]
MGHPSRGVCCVRSTRLEVIVGSVAVIAGMADSSVSDERVVDFVSTDGNHVAKAFDIEVVCDSLQRCIQDKNAIDLDHYLRAFNELLRYYSLRLAKSWEGLRGTGVDGSGVGVEFFNLLGAVFIFVAKDVKEKIQILEKYTKECDCGPHYGTLQKMIEYEI